MRGHIHQAAFFVSLGAGALLVLKSTDEVSRLSSLIYAASLMLLFGISALYHRPHWSPGPRAIMKRLDHSAIFILIAGSFTPVCLLGLPTDRGEGLLWTVWTFAIAGILQSIFWSKAPAWLAALFYVGLGWLAIPYVGDMAHALGVENVWLLAAGGFAYTVGAVVYASKRPILNPRVFGYHELFHALTIVGATTHFIVIYQLIR